MLNLIVQSVQERKARDSAERSVRMGIAFLSATGLSINDATDPKYRSALLAIATAIHSDNGKNPERLVSRDTANNAITHYNQDESVRTTVTGMIADWKKTFTTEAETYFEAEDKADWLNKNRPNLSATPRENGKFFVITTIPHTPESIEGWDTIYREFSK